MKCLFYLVHCPLYIHYQLNLIEDISSSGIVYALLCFNAVMEATLQEDIVYWWHLTTLAHCRVSFSLITKSGKVAFGRFLLDDVVGVAEGGWSLRTGAGGPGRTGSISASPGAPNQRSWSRRATPVGARSGATLERRRTARYGAWMVGAGWRRALLLRPPATRKLSQGKLERRTLGKTRRISRDWFICSPCRGKEGVTTVYQQWYNHPNNKSIYLTTYLSIYLSMCNKYFIIISCTLYTFISIMCTIFNTQNRVCVHFSVYIAGRSAYFCVALV